MKGNRITDYNQTTFEADEARASYVAGDYNKLGKIAFGCIRLIEVAKDDQTVEVKNRTVLQQYTNDIFTKHSCLVLKTNNVYSYTRNNVCKFVRGQYAHTYESDPHSNNQKKKLKVLEDFMLEKSSANVLFCVMRVWVKTPFIQAQTPSHDSQFFMKDEYTNQSGQKSKLGVIESLIFNINDEIAYIINNGKIGWPVGKAIWPFVDSYEKDFGKEKFDKIKDTIPWLIKMNDSAIANNKT